MCGRLIQHTVPTPVSVALHLALSHIEEKTFEYEARVSEVMVHPNNV